MPMRDLLNARALSCPHSRSYWNNLRLRYWAPESRPYHQQAWQAMGQRAAPLLARVPALQRCVGGGDRGGGISLALPSPLLAVGW